MSNPIPIFEAKNKLPFYVHKAESEGAVTLSRRNKEVAVLISITEYNSLLESAKSAKKEKTFLERVSDFRKQNSEFYKNDNFDELYNEFTQIIESRDRSYPDYDKAAHIWDGIMEDD